MLPFCFYVLVLNDSRDGFLGNLPYRVFAIISIVPINKNVKLSPPKKPVNPSNALTLVRV